MTGPSAIGSENGTPSSITSQPALARACSSGTASFGSGSPAVTKGIRAFLPCSFSLAKVAAMRDMALEPDPRLLRDGMHVLVAAAGKIDQQDLVLPHARSDLGGVGQRVRRFERRHDALQPAQVVEGLQRLLVCDR